MTRVVMPPSYLVAHWVSSVTSDADFTAVQRLAWEYVWPESGVNGCMVKVLLRHEEIASILVRF